MGISQVGKATDFDSVMHRFEPCIPYQNLLMLLGIRSVTVVSIV